jgi:hypothetical protein
MDARERQLAEAVRQACLAAAIEAAEQAGLAGLCAEGRLEAALDAIRAVPVERVNQTDSARSGSERSDT